MSWDGIETSGGSGQCTFDGARGSNEQALSGRLVGLNASSRQKVLSSLKFVRSREDLFVVHSSRAHLSWMLAIHEQSVPVATWSVTEALAHGHGPVKF